MYNQTIPYYVVSSKQLFRMKIGAKNGEVADFLINSEERSSEEFMQLGI